jgi:hypothetical protein
MDKFLDKLNNLSAPIMSDEIEAVIIIPRTIKRPKIDNLLLNFITSLKKK